MKSILLFIHGAGESHKVWEHQIKFFSDLIAIDLPGHDVGVGRRTIDEYVGDVKKFCDERGLKNIVMVGHSMGGAIVQKFTLEHPEYLKAIVLVCTGAKLRVTPLILETIKKNYAQAIELITNLAFSKKAPSETKEKAAEEMRNINSEVTYGDFEACDKFNIMDRLKEIKVPTLIICGLEDQLTPVKYSEYLKNNIPNSKLEMIADAGHMVMLEKPKEFNEILEKFIKELGSC
ncbi:MAG: Proline iminopeptidase [Candidatus Bathyarchaeota archaeon BA1]|nr:MAG: Proline iminopeptidase [Candidatus Bathyarchaeota archaeon BA1]